MLVRDLSADLIEGFDAAGAGQKNTAMGKRGSSPALGGAQLTGKSTGVSETQLVYIRALLDSTFNEKSPGMKGGFMKETDLTSHQAADLQSFFNDSYYFPYMLNLSGKLPRGRTLSS